MLRTLLGRNSLKTVLTLIFGSQPTFEAVALLGSDDRFKFSTFIVSGRGVLKVVSFASRTRALSGILLP